jgi:antirestriction protein ArdC
MRNHQSHPTQRRDHYQELTDKIIAALEAGVAPWRRPWDPNACGESTTPVNVATGHRYRGVNLFVLGMSPLAFTSGDPRWCSYRQAAARGWQVRKGEKATPVYFYKTIEIEDRAADSGDPRRIPMLRMFSVFHASQIDGVPALTPPTATKTVPERIQDVELIVVASGVPVQIGGNRAFYSPALDVIQMPPDEAFHSPEERAVVVLHELGHYAEILIMPRRPTSPPRGLRRATRHAGIIRAPPGRRAVCRRDGSDRAWRRRAAFLRWPSL